MPAISASRSTVVFFRPVSGEANLGGFPQFRPDEPFFVFGKRRRHPLTPKMTV